MRTPPEHLVSPRVSRYLRMSIVVHNCFCNSASVLLNFILTHYIVYAESLILSFYSPSLFIFKLGSYASNDNRLLCLKCYVGVPWRKQCSLQFPIYVSKRLENSWDPRLTKFSKFWFQEYIIKRILFFWWNGFCHRTVSDLFLISQTIQSCTVI